MYEQLTLDLELDIMDVKPTTERAHNGSTLHVCI
jgi:hypothetical protein